VDLSPELRIETLEQEGGRIVDLATPANLDNPVPSCPDWTMRDLVSHLARIYGWAGTIVEGQLQERPDRDALPARPEEMSVVDWLSDRLDFLLGALRRTPRTVPIWNFTGTPAPAGWWIRRQANETIIHRVDAELAAHAAVTDVEPPVAADVVDELFELFGFEATDLEGFDHAADLWIHLHATDGEGAEWTIDTGARRFSRAHMKGDVALRGPSFSLARWLTGRASIGTLEAFGDTAAADAWRASIEF